MAIRGQSGDGFAKMYSLIVCANGTGTPKIVQDAQPYSGEILDVRQSKFDKAAEIGGARLFSFSDFDLTKTFDIMQIMWDCAARKAKITEAPAKAVMPATSLSGNTSTRSMPTIFSG